MSTIEELSTLAVSLDRDLNSVSASGFDNSVRKPMGDGRYELVSGFSMAAKLVRHSKAVIAIALISGSNKLYSCNKDKSVWVWGCNTDQCAVVANLEEEI
ncbi:hypothetical protein F0562_017900 [Nyssa sinensis]|uniref:Uncharacterized protein n=1 Tax=Nyssa sinensis TaxID=561372 RepID=A0A5J4ZBU8_9ASTE|nr:hypothetical protein F0562_017900 [Nyssa sinensis]